MLKLRQNSDSDWRTAVEDAEAPHGLVGGVGKIFEGELFEASGVKRREFAASHWPGHLALGIGGLAAASDDEKEAAGPDERSDFLDGFCAQRAGQNLERVRLEYEIEFMRKRCGRIQQIAHSIIHFTFGIPLASRANGGLRNVERRGAIAPC